MKKYILNILLSAVLLSCADTDNIKGVWRCDFLDTQILKRSNIIFEDLGRYEKGYFEPIFEFSDAKLRYDLGFGSNDFEFNDNYCVYKLNEGLVNLNCGDRSQNFSINQKANDKFCIFLEGDKMACFVRITNNEKMSNDDYTIDLEIINDLYEISLTLSSDGKGVIYRKGEVTDTTNFYLNKNEVDYISSLVHRIDSSSFKMENRNIGGDQAKYGLRLKSNKTKYVGTVEGLNGVSFETKALIVNLENLITRTFSPKNK